MTTGCQIIKEQAKELKSSVSINRIKTSSSKKKSKNAKWYSMASTDWNLSWWYGVSRIKVEYASNSHTQQARQYNLCLPMHGGSLSLVGPTTNAQEEMVIWHDRDNYVLRN